jgi:hypothetical protein
MGQASKVSTQLLNCSIALIERAFTDRIKGDLLACGGAAALNVFEEPLGLERVRFDDDGFATQIVGHGVAAHGLHAPGFEGDSGLLFVGHLLERNICQTGRRTYGKSEKGTNESHRGNYTT